ncbi:MAG: nitroreductase family protein [Desulfovibrio sp.]|jgi:nitroreductase|nr:nitroreductase family protein [Desulfovibrio sp.]
MQLSTRRNFLCLGGIAAALGMVFRASPAYAADAETDSMWMSALTAIQTRRSIRLYTEQPVDDKSIKTLLAAGMAAPSAGNERPWEFVVIRNPETLTQVGSINKYAAYAKKAPVAILTCVNTEREKFPGNGIVDVAACTQNILLAAHAIGLGAVWTGIYPEQDRIEAFRLLLDIPEKVIPLALVVIGHPRPRAPREDQDRFDATRVHVEKW